MLEVERWGSLNVFPKRGGKRENLIVGRVGFEGVATPSHPNLVSSFYTSIPYDLLKSRISNLCTLLSENRSEIYP